MRLTDTIIINPFHITRICKHIYLVHLGSFQINTLNWFYFSWLFNWVDLYIKRQFNPNVIKCWVHAMFRLSYNKKKEKKNLDGVTFCIGYKFYKEKDHSKKEGSQPSDQRFTVRRRLLSTYFIRGGGESEAHRINTDANHTCTKFSQSLFGQIFFVLMLTKEYVLFLRISYFYINSKMKAASPLRVIYIYYTYINTSWAKPNVDTLFIEFTCGHRWPGSH